MKLLKTFYLVIFLFLALNFINAQGFGVRAGANFSSLSNTHPSSQTGVYAGAYKQIRVIPKLLFIQPEVQFSKQGFSTKFNNADLNYINVPILAKVFLLKMFSFETGPQFGFMTNKSTTGIIKSDINTFEKAWAYGMQFRLPLGFSIDGRYITGFNDIIKNSGSKSRVFQLGAGFKF